MLPQTNLQLYRLMIERGTNRESLTAVRSAYDVGRQLFAGCFRPSHKPFISHLVGTAAALVRWQQPTDVVVAGLLHSAYLFGQWNDGRRGANTSRREWITEQVGASAEQLVAAYTSANWKRAPEELMAECDVFARQLNAIKLADLLDELCDGGPRFSPQKQLELNTNDAVELARQCVGEQAALELSQAASEVSETIIPDSLCTCDRSFHVMRTGVPELNRIHIAHYRAKLEKLLHYQQTA